MPQEGPIIAALEEPRRPGVEHPAALAATNGVALETTAAATVIVGVGAAVVLGSDLLAAKQLALGVTAGMVLDLLMIRAARAGPGSALVVNFAPHGRR